MFTYDKELLESNFCNVGLVDKRDFPKALEIIQKSYVNVKNSQDSPEHRNKPTIQTGARKAACRITSQLKNNLRNLTFNNESSFNLLDKNKIADRSFNYNDENLLHNRSLSLEKVPKVDPLPKDYYSANKVLPVKKGAEMNIFKTGPSQVPYDSRVTIENSRYSSDMQPKNSKDVTDLSRFQKEYNPKINEKDPFLRRIQEYRYIYEAFTSNFGSQPKKRQSQVDETKNDRSIEFAPQQQPRNKSLMGSHHRNLSNIESELPPLYNNSIDQKDSVNDLSFVKKSNPVKGGGSPLANDQTEAITPQLLKYKPKRPDFSAPIKNPKKPDDLDFDMVPMNRGPEKSLGRFGPPQKANKNMEEGFESPLLSSDTSNRTDSKFRSKSMLRPRPTKKSVASQPNDEESMEAFSQDVANLLDKCTGDPTIDFDVAMESLMQKLKKHHPILSKISFKALSELLRTCTIINIKNQELYKEKEHNEYCYIIIYGEVYLKSKMYGVFKRCLIGDSIGEEAIIENNFTKQETAQVIAQTALLEINLNYLGKFKDALSSGYRSDYTVLLGMLRKNMSQKKVIRQKIANGR